MAGQLAQPPIKKTIKNVSSSISLKKSWTSRLRDSLTTGFQPFFSSTLVYELIFMNVNIGKTQIFHKMKYHLKGHLGYTKVVHWYNLSLCSNLKYMT